MTKIPLSQPMPYFKVYCEGVHPQKKKHFFFGKYFKRAKARQFCRSKTWEKGLTIVHPDGSEEPYVSRQYNKGRLGK